MPNPRFARFLDVLKASLDVSLKHGPDLGSLPAIYDGLAGQSRILAKMALLNLYGVLTDTTDPVSRQSWFSFVRKFVLIDRERFVAEVDPALDESVQTILANLSAYSAQGFFTESPKLHYDNIPPAYKLTSDLITLKVRYEQGNVQFTLGRAIGLAATEAVLLDCDMDEHSNVIAHLDDLFIHLFTGGTNPIDIHEYVVHHDAGIDLGYTLRPGSF